MKDSEIVEIPYGIAAETVAAAYGLSVSRVEKARAKNNLRTDNRKTPVGFASAPAIECGWENEHRRSMRLGSELLGEKITKMFAKRK
jgi:hypothetical protein